MTKLSNITKAPPSQVQVDEKNRKTKFYYKGEPVDIVNFGSDKQTVVVRPFNQSKNDILIWTDDLEER